MPGGGGVDREAENQPIRGEMVLLFGQNHLTGLARKSCMVVSAILVSVVACTYMQFCRLNRKVISHGLFPHNQLKRMPNLNDFSLFVSKSAIELACVQKSLNTSYM